MANNEYVVEYAKTGRSGCKDTKCKKKIAEDSVRFGKIFDSPFGDDKQTHWYHPECIFNYFARAKASTKKIESSDDIQGFDSLNKSDQKIIENLISSGGKSKGTKKGGKKRKEPATKTTNKGKKKKKKTEDDEEEGDDGDEDDSGDGELVHLEADTKFWEYKQSGKKVFVRWGKVGGNGQSDTKTFPTVEKAQKFAEKKQAEKEKKGYEVVKKKKGTTKASKKGSVKGSPKGSKKGKKKEESKKGSKKGSAKGSKKGSKKGGGGGGKTYLEADSGSGGKFWEVEVSGTDVTTRYGRVGSDGTSNTKSYPSEEKAQKEADKLIRQKKGKGYS